MSNVRTVPKCCPFCGERDLRLYGPEPVDDSREYECSLTCERCDGRMAHRIGHRFYKPTTECHETMIEALFRKWNQRSGLKITVTVKP